MTVSCHTLLLFCSEVAEAHAFMTWKDQFMQSMESQWPKPSWWVGSKEWGTQVIRSCKAFGFSDQAAADTGSVTKSLLVKEAVRSQRTVYPDVFAAG
jgi:hypothetical protein